MEHRHIRIDYPEALEAKKQVLSSEINSLSVAKKIENFMFYRKNEFTLKNQLRETLSHIRAKIEHLETTLPEDEKIEKIKIVQKSREIKENKNLQQELSEIQKKLADMGR